MLKLRACFLGWGHLIQNICFFHKNVKILKSLLFDFKKYHLYRMSILRGKYRIKQKYLFLPERQWYREKLPV